MIEKKHKISVITPSYNQGQFIEETILSVLNQNYDNFEHIVVDGGSTDETVQILKKYPHLKWVSEKDEGQSDALNKGLVMATGDIIGWLNSDDYYEKNIFSDVVGHFEDQSVEWVVGNTANYHEPFCYKRLIESSEITYENLLKNSRITRQPGTFYRREILERVGGLDKEVDFVMDYDLWIRLSKISVPKMVDKNYAYFRIHPEQKTTALFLTKIIKEVDKVLKREKVSFFLRKKAQMPRYKSFVKYLLKLVLIRFHIIDKKYATVKWSTRKQNGC